MPHLGKCWEWTGHINKNGYGYGYWEEEKRSAHRISWMINYGKVFDGLWVLHKCDNRSCVRPEHLFLGTNQDNVDDMVKKGRAKTYRGENHIQHKLTQAQVNEIRKRFNAGGITKRDLSKEFNVSDSTIGRIIKLTSYN